MPKIVKKSIRSLINKLGLDIVPLELSPYALSSKTPQHSGSPPAVDQELLSNLSDRQTQLARRYIHIGYPKAGSSALQRCYFSQHPQILHFGCGCNDSGYSYIDSTINTLFEVDVRLRCSLDYDAAQAKSVLDDYLQQADRNPKTMATGISSEMLSVTLIKEVDVVEKAKRLLDLFGRDTAILIFVRNQKSLYQSLYCELLRHGLSASFEEWLGLIYANRHSSIFVELQYEQLYEVYASLFGKENITVLPFELFSSDSETFLATLDSALGVPSFVKSIPKINTSLSLQEMYLLRELNQRTRYDFGNDYWSPVLLHRISEIFSDDIHSPWKNEAEINFQLRRAIVNLATELAKTLDVPQLDLEFPKEYESLFQESYGPTNRSFSQQTGIDLKSYGYWC